MCVIYNDALTTQLLVVLSEAVLTQAQVAIDSVHTHFVEPTAIWLAQ